MTMLTTVERARLVHQFLSVASESPQGDGVCGAQVIGSEIIAFVRSEADAFSGTFGEFTVRSVVVGDIEVSLSDAEVACLPDAKDVVGSNPT